MERKEQETFLVFLHFKMLLTRFESLLGALLHGKWYPEVTHVSFVPSISSLNLGMSQTLLAFNNLRTIGYDAYSRRRDIQQEQSLLERQELLRKLLTLTGVCDEMFCACIFGENQH